MLTSTIPALKTVLAKSCKMVPVMLMGYVVNKKTYSAFEYLVAIGVTAGAAVFKLYETNDAPVKNTEFVGIILIVGYMGSDSFTSNWQSSVFKEYKVSSMAMMMYAPRTPFPSLTSLLSTRALLSLSLSRYSLSPSFFLHAGTPTSSRPPSPPSAC